MTNDKRINIAIAFMVIFCIAIVFYGCASTENASIVDEPLDLQGQPDVVIKTDEQPEVVIQTSPDAVIKTPQLLTQPIITSIKPSKISGSKFNITIKGTDLLKEWM
ncbi:MAG: hypothetical protein HY805_06395 [Nitrospirae bacterium]|nr:hypothetical protein [Nitrospirota bacterium]